eukprot:scaffold170928_cov31-Tisochrysis_lutea.AAC.1
MACAQKWNMAHMTHDVAHGILTHIYAHIAHRTDVVTRHSSMIWHTDRNDAASWSFLEHEWCMLHAARAEHRGTRDELHKNIVLHNGFQSVSSRRESRPS